MRNFTVSIKEIRELELDIANLQVTISDKQRLLTELKLQQVDFGPKEVPKVAKPHLPSSPT